MDPTDKNPYLAVDVVDMYRVLVPALSVEKWPEMNNNDKHNADQTVGKSTLPTLSFSR